MELVQRSFQGGILILAILLIRILWLDRLPKRTFPILWTVALARLLMPFSFSSGLSLYTLLQVLQRRGMPEQATGALAEGGTMTGALPAWTVAEVPGSELPVLASGCRLEVLWVIWWAGVIVMALFFVSAYLWSRWNFRRALPVENEQVQQWLDRCGKRRKGLVGRIAIRQWDQILAPLTYGCLRPVILLPRKALWDGGQDLEFILQHEFMHICHCDGVLKLVMTAVLCLHWFNPLVWIMCRVMNRDLELACDEAVLRSFGEPAKAKYAMALIGMEEKKRILLPLYSGFSKNAIEERINLIMKYKKMKYAGVVVSSVLVVLVALVFATSAKTAEAIGNPILGSGGDAETRTEVGADDLTTEQKSDGLGANRQEVERIEGDHTGEETTVSKESLEYTLHYMQEGLPQEQPAYLHRGLDYGILIPTEGWKAYGSNGWQWESNEEVRFWVIDYHGNTRQQVAYGLEEEGYAQTEEADFLKKEGDGKIYFACLRGSGTPVVGLHYTYPADPEYQEGFGTILSAIAANFAVLPRAGENLSEDGQQAEEMVLAFWEAYLAGDQEGMRQYLVEDYTGDIEGFPDGVDGHVAKESVVNAVKGLNMEPKMAGEQCEFWVEFWPRAEADSLEYLTISAVKEADGWRIRWYGLEG